MRAWRYTAPGSLDATLQLDNDAPHPTDHQQQPSDRQVLVKVLASGLNPADFKVQELPLGFTLRALFSYPKTAGMDLCGSVTAVGKDISDLRVGDHVIGRLNPFLATGSLSEYVSMDREKIALVSVSPSSSTSSTSSVTEAAGLPTVGLTAYQTIAPHVHPDRGDRVLINGGSGGVGTMCIQVAKLLGCHVTVTCSTAKVELCRDLGADKIIDYKEGKVVESLTRESQEGQGRPYHLIVDNVGNAPADLFSSSNDYLSPGRPYIFVGGNISFATVKNLVFAATIPAFLGGVKGSFRTFITKDSQQDLDALAKWFEEGKIRVIVDKVFPFEEAKVAMQYVKQGSSRGKVVVKM